MRPAARCAIQIVADLQNDPAAGFDATTYPTALMPPVRPRADPAVHLTLDPRLDRRSRLPRQNGGPWRLTAPALVDALAALAGRHPRLGATGCPQLGVKTGANAVFLEPPAASSRR